MRIQGSLLLLIAVLVCAGCYFASPCHSSAQPPAKPPELKVLERFIGKWKIETISKPAEWTPKEERFTGTSTNEWVLDGWFQHHKVKDDQGTEGIELLTFDPRMKTYRYWSFFSNGLIKEMTGEWDEKSKTFTTKADIGNGITVVGKMHFIDSDNRESTVVAKDAAGKVYLDLRGKLTRQK